MKKKFLVLIILTLIFLVLFARTGENNSFEKPMLTFRFDDGYKSQLNASNILKKNNLKATFFIITNRLGTDDYMSWVDVQELNNNGFEIGSHSKTHKNMMLLLSGSHRNELVQSKEELRQMGITVKTFAYPYGIYNYKFLYQVKEEYDSAGGYNIFSNGLNTPRTNKYKIKCKEFDDAKEFEQSLIQAIENKAWLVACFHRIDDEQGKYKISEDEFRKIARIAERSGVNVVSFSEGSSHLK